VQFRQTLTTALKRNLIEIVTLANAQGGAFWQTEANNEWLAGVAFLISKTEAKELLGTVEIMVAVLFDREEPIPSAFGPTHLLRTLALLQVNRSHAELWHRLWAKGAAWLRPLILFGWVRSEPSEAIRHVNELVTTTKRDALPSALNALLQPGGLSIFDLANSLTESGAETQQKARQALEDAGCDAMLLRDFEAALLPAAVKADGFPFDVPKPSDSVFTRHFVGWDTELVAA
jgi:hypothetical protein